ncbi:MAG: hypothetical protein PHU17_02605 [Candidatus Pacebacteria bacterium]|nr:hypothetical protein [Candidatus Paceibacterota bacterium]MDD4074384.1 hypothetical protein [Candidatus Paceibacterota bacterium]
MEFKTLLGWLLIVFGILIVFWSIQSSYTNFTNQTEFPQVFQIDESSIVTEENSSGSVEDKIGSIIGNQVSQMIPQSTVTQLLNMLSWIVFATFLVFAGAKVVGMGADLLRSPKKEKEE